MNDDLYHQEKIKAERDEASALLRELINAHNRLLHQRNVSAIYAMDLVWDKAQAWAQRSPM